MWEIVQAGGPDVAHHSCSIVAPRSSSSGCDAAGSRVLPPDLTQKVWKLVEAKQDHRSGESSPSSRIAARQSCLPPVSPIASAARNPMEILEDTGRHVVYELERFLQHPRPRSPCLAAARTTRP